MKWICNVILMGQSTFPCSPEALSSTCKQLRVSQFGPPCNTEKSSKYPTLASNISKSSKKFRKSFEGVNKIGLSFHKKMSVVGANWCVLIAGTLKLANFAP